MSVWSATAAGVVMAAGASAAQPVTATFAVPTMDRWMYSFNQASPLGSETQAQVFSSVGSPYQSSFDNRDGQFLLGYDTGGIIAAGLGADQYRVISARVVARISRDSSFRYDPT